MKGKVIVLFALIEGIQNYYCDDRPVMYATADYSYVLDKVFDKTLTTASIAHFYGSVMAPAIFIDYHLILTAFSPFRKIQKEKRSIDTFKACIFIGRTSRENQGITEYVLEYQQVSIICGRQIVPIPEDLIPEHSWHGEEKLHTSLHDLIVFRLIPREYVYRNRPSHIWYDYPKVVHVAKPHEEMDKYVIFASYGFMNKDHMKSWNTFLSSKYYYDIEIDCDRYFPRLWGHFICLKNEDNYQGLGAGAILLSNEALFGIGGFVLKKGNFSILVFTDVRRYYHMLGSPCSLNEHIVPKHYNYEWNTTKWNFTTDYNQYYYLRPDRWEVIKDWKEFLTKPSWYKEEWP